MTHLVMYTLCAGSRIPVQANDFCEARRQGGRHFSENSSKEMVTINCCQLFPRLNNSLRFGITNPPIHPDTTNVLVLIKDFVREVFKLLKLAFEMLAPCLFRTPFRMLLYSSAKCYTFFSSSSTIAHYSANSTGLLPCYLPFHGQGLSGSKAHNFLSQLTRMAHIGPAAILYPGAMKHVTNYNIGKSSGKGEENPRQKIGLDLSACLRVCADGGANRLFDELPPLFPKDDPDIVRRRYKPDVIKGDLDSIRPDVRDFYADLGTSIIDESHDQDTTDLHKCVVFIKDCTPNIDKSNLKLVVVGALGGRFDHEAANINVLHTFAKDLQIVLLSEESSLTVLPTGHVHEIHVDRSFEGPHCGLIPVGAPSLSTTSTGLRWNLNETAMAFGSLISTCNMIESDVVTVISDVYLIWTSEIRYQS